MNKIVPGVQLTLICCNNTANECREHMSLNQSEYGTQNFQPYCKQTELDSLIQ